MIKLFYFPFILLLLNCNESVTKNNETVSSNFQSSYLDTVTSSLSTNNEPSSNGPVANEYSSSKGIASGNSSIVLSSTLSSSSLPNTSSDISEQGVSSAQLLNSSSSINGNSVYIGKWFWWPKDRVDSLADRIEFKEQGVFEAIIDIGIPSSIWTGTWREEMVDSSTVLFADINTVINNRIDCDETLNTGPTYHAYVATCSSDTTQPDFQMNFYTKRYDGDSFICDVEFINGEYSEIQLDTMYRY